MIAVPAMNPNSDNPKVGRVFQELAAKLLTDYYGVTFNTEVSIPIGTPAKPHRFDCVSADRKIVVECKYYTWTYTGNIPSAKIAFINQSILYALLLPNGVKKSYCYTKGTASSQDRNTCRVLLSHISPLASGYCSFGDRHRNEYS